MRWSVPLVAALALVVLGAACSGDESASSSTTAADDSAQTEVAEAPVDVAAETSGAAVPSAGCEAPAGQTGAKQRRDIDVDGADRWYLVTAPEPAVGSDPVPLVVDFHGLTEGAEFHSNATGWSELAESEGFVAVFPNGSGDPVAWNVASSGPNPDLDFVDAMLEQLESEYCIDTSRVYATGLSNGAFMSSVLACTRSDTFAAVAPVAGLTHPPDCAAERPVPVLSFHGTADPLLPFNGSVSGGAISGLVGEGEVTTTTAPPGDIDGEGYPANAAAWAAANGCGGSSDEQVSDSVVSRVWDCPDHAQVEFYMVVGGGHTWPGSEALADGAIAKIVGPTTFEIDATQITWDFFASQQLPA